MGRLRRWPLAVLIALDQLANAILLGSEDDTISSRAWKAKLKGRAWGKIAVPIIDGLFVHLGQLNHCQLSAEWDEH